MSAFTDLKEKLKQESNTWVITGAAGFIGSHLVENLLRLNQKVVGFDNFATGHQYNLNKVSDIVGSDLWKNFRLVNGDIRHAETCHSTLAGADYVLHQAALGSVPRSIADPLTTHAVNVDGTVNILLAARDAKVKRLVFASSSSIYGDEPNLPKREDRIGKPLSPYALSKAVNEQYAENYGKVFGLETVGLRYFNVFGARQDPEGQYAAVIPKWTSAMIHGEKVLINGKGDTSRDFCYIDNVVQANLLAATAPGVGGQAFNVALNARTTLNELFNHLRDRLVPHYPHLKNIVPEYVDYRAGDVMHSQAEIGKAEKLLGYSPTHSVAQGLDLAMSYYRSSSGRPAL